MNVTGLHWPPSFIQYVETAADGTRVQNYKGPDGLLFRAVANALNFKFNFLPVRNWKEVSAKLGCVTPM